MPVFFKALQPTDSDSGLSKRRTLYSGLWIAAAMLVVNGCSTGNSASGHDEAAEQVSAFRVRTDFSAALNADSGWAAETNQTAQVWADDPFRLRLEIEHNDAKKPRQYTLQVRRNEGDWQPLHAENFPQPAKELELNFEQRRKGAPSEYWQWVSGSEEAMIWVGDAEAGDAEERYLQLTADESPALALATYHTHWLPVEFAADVRLPKGQQGSAGLVFDYEDAGNYRRVDLEAGAGLHLVQVTDGEQQVLASHPFDVPTGQWAELKIIMRGQDITVEYADEALVFTETMSNIITSPRVGVFAEPGSSLQLPAIVIEGLPGSPRISIIEADSFDHGEKTHDLLSGTDRPYQGGAGISFAEQTPIQSMSPGQSEWEFPIVIRRFSDGAALNQTGDRFEFRVVNQSGEVLPSVTPLSVSLAVPEQLLGGTFVETPMRIGPWQASSGDLYFLMEPAETDNRLMTVKSSDGGRTWVEMDGANRPATGDLEGFASMMADDEIHMLHQTSDHVFYHVFRTADHSGQPDTWAIRDERLASPEEPPTQVADIAVRSDGSVVAVYGGPEKIHYRIRSPAGKWSEETVVDRDRAPNLSGPSMVLDAQDVVHLTYTGDDGSAWYRQLRPNGELTERQPFAFGLGAGSEDIGSILPLVYLPESDSVSVIYRLASGHLWERRVGPQGEFSEPVQVTERTVAQNAVDSDQTGADAIAYKGSVQVLFIDADTGHLYYTSRAADGTWHDAEPQVTDANVQWVRGAVVKTAQGKSVYGYVYDAGADGGSGKNRYGEVPLSSTAGN
ncbi:sialidase family protein [Marinimicrobium sp. ARAG 43.8]|uniref:sialidase family protein n=1 Tax=Marinimicrobium sp. ARAG 43.8 TaxID=3418719 RepID=UPI003CE7FED9